VVRCFALVVALASAAAVPVACTGSETPATSQDGGSRPAYADISPAELAVMLKDEDFVLVNTHVPYEGEIEQTDLFLPYDQAARLIDQLPADKAEKIVVYCRSDRMSRIAAEKWAAAGYTNLLNLEGGFIAWEEAGHPLLHLDRQ
jgi:rhodanese-related sulfurtransferase